MRYELRKQKSQTLFERDSREFVWDFMFSVNRAFMIVCDEDLAVVLRSRLLFAEFRIEVVRSGQCWLRSRIQLLIFDLENLLCRYPWAVLDADLCWSCNDTVFAVLDILQYSEFHNDPPFIISTDMKKGCQSMYCLRRVRGSPTTLS